MDNQSIQEAVLEANKEAEMMRRRAHFKIVADLFRDGTADVSNDPKWVALLNKPKGFEESNPRMTLEKYMECFPEDVNEALMAAKYYRDSGMYDGPNRHSLAYYSYLGPIPECISKLFNDVYPDAADKRKAMRRFFREFPAFKVNPRSV